MLVLVLVLVLARARVADVAESALRCTALPWRCCARDEVRPVARCSHASAHADAISRAAHTLYWRQHRRRRPAAHPQSSSWRQWRPRPLAQPVRFPTKEFPCIRPSRLRPIPGDVIFSLPARPRWQRCRCPPSPVRHLPRVRHPLPRPIPPLTELHRCRTLSPAPMAPRSSTRTGARASPSCSRMAGPSAPMPGMRKCCSWVRTASASLHMTAAATAVPARPGTVTTWTPTPMIWPP